MIGFVTRGEYDYMARVENERMRATRPGRKRRRTIRAGIRANARAGLLSARSRSSILSLGSLGSILSIGSILCIGSADSILPRGKEEPEADEP